MSVMESTPSSSVMAGLSGPPNFLEGKWVARMKRAMTVDLEKVEGDLTQRRQVCRGLIHQSLEGAGLVRGEIGEDLAVDLDARLGEPADKSAVGDAVFAAAGIDALDPKRAEVTLLLLAADVVVLQRAIDGGVGRRDRVLAAAVKALGGLEDLLAAGVTGDGTG